MSNSVSIDNEKKNFQPMTPLQEFWFYFSKNRGAVIGLIYVVVMLLVAIFAPLIAPHSAFELFKAPENMSFPLPPAWLEGGSAKFLLGTDDIGRDLLSRIIHGARLSLLIAFVVVTLSLLLGVAIGIIAGYVGGYVDQCIMRVADIMMALPSLLLALVLVAILGQSLYTASLALTFVGLPHYIRLTRAQVIAEIQKDYVVASKIVGAGHFRQMFKNILPNCLAPLIVQGSLGFSNAILDMAALGFLGMGIQPPAPEWGTLLSDGLKFLQSAWWIVVFPGMTILFTVLAFNLVGDGLRDAFDPKLKQ
ncbi:dipeptide ABC transporter permease DppC [Thorsellia kenyensis]|uniref:Dipeptide ABC transporter permease DppC n=1 Tax=Thorsellia kenyensis TaxID=1549888 RepID=A0ABV6C8E4_9GAMM